MAAMSEADAAEQGREPDEPAGGGDGFPEEDVAPEEPDPDLDVADPFGVGDEREPLEPGSDEDPHDGSVHGSVHGSDHGSDEPDPEG